MEWNLIFPIISYCVKDILQHISIDGRKWGLFALMSAAATTMFKYYTLQHLGIYQNKLWGHCCQNQVSRACNIITSYIILYDMITYPCHNKILLKIDASCSVDSHVTCRQMASILISLTLSSDSMASNASNLLFILWIFRLRTEKLALYLDKTGVKLSISI